MVPSPVSPGLRSLPTNPNLRRATLQSQHRWLRLRVPSCAFLSRNLWCLHPAERVQKYLRWKTQPLSNHRHLVLLRRDPYKSRTPLCFCLPCESPFEFVFQFVVGFCLGLTASSLVTLSLPTM